MVSHCSKTRINVCVSCSLAGYSPNWPLDIGFTWKIPVNIDCSGIVFPVGPVHTAHLTCLTENGIADGTETFGGNDITVRVDNGKKTDGTVVEQFPHRIIPHI